MTERRKDELVGKRLRGAVTYLAPPKCVCVSGLCLQVLSYSPVMAQQQ